MIDTADWLEALEGPAALFDAHGTVAAANAAFRALPDADRPALEAERPADRASGGRFVLGDGWREAGLAGGMRLITAVDARVARRGRMLATLSHEIRTPLNGVLGMAGLLAGTTLDATQRAYLDTLRDSGEHLLGLVNDVLDYAKLDAGRLELELAPTDPERLLQGVCELLSPRAHAAGLEIAWSSVAWPDSAAHEPPPPRVWADDGRLRQILFNLAGNAVKLTRNGGVLVTVAARAAGPSSVTLRFQVADTGPGLAAEAQARVFEEFEQAEHGQQAGGAGLGLAIVRRLAAAMDGRLGVESRPGQGATFWFEAEFAPMAAPSGGDAPPGLQGMRVGVASPSPIVRAAALAQIAASGGEGLAFDTSSATATAPVDAILVDSDPTTPLGPPPCGADRAFVLLAPEARSGIETARALGYAGYLIKPLRRASLVARLAEPASPEPFLAPAATSPAKAPPAEDERAAVAAGRDLRVLLAEDNPVNALLARALLQREGCMVDRAASGEEAVAAAARAPYDLILMDLRMPGLDGLAATRALRAAGVTTRVVALTANAFEEDRRACRDAGMDDFLTKPLDAAALRAILAPGA